MMSILMRWPISQNKDFYGIMEAASGGAAFFFREIEQIEFYPVY